MASKMYHIYMYVLYCMHLYHVILGLASFLLQPASGSEFKLNEAPKIDLSKAEEDWAKILHGPGPGPCAEPGSDCEMDEQNLL